MANLANFAEIIKQANEEKKLRALQEKTRQEKEVAPLLSELFSTIAKGKEAKHESDIKAAPLLAELKSALADPEKFIKEKQNTKTKIVELVTELENKASDIQAKIDNSVTPNKIDPTDIEKKFLKLFNRLQNDFQTLKKYVESKPTQSPIGFGGSGEVRILRMDDVVSGVVPENGSVMTWNASLNKFEFIVPIVVGNTTASDEEMPYAKRVDFVSDDEFYKGEASVGSSESSPVWRIRKIVIGNDSDVTETWASGNSLYDKVWADRLTLIYS
jgi:hypothetical protein